MKVGLYSVTYLGLWYDGPALDIRELIGRASRFGYDGIEIDGKRPHAHPLDLSPTACRALAREAADAGVEIYAVAANNDFSSSIAEIRDSQLACTRQLIDLASALGAGILRVFAAWPGVHHGSEGGSYEVAEKIWSDEHQSSDREELWERCRDGLIQLSGWAEDAGILLALQNHPQVVNNAGDMLRMIAEVGSPHLKACFDAPLAYKQGVTDMQKIAGEVGALQILTHFGGEYSEDTEGHIRSIVRWRDGRVEPETFYTDFVTGMREIGYDGYIGYELCHPLPLVNGLRPDIQFVDRNVELAARFMRQLLARTAASHSAAPVLSR